MPRLSIIIPTFNSAKTLSRCLDSVISQSFTDWEVLMMDGVSNDDTIIIASSYQDSRIRIYSEPDKGIYDAMNKGIDKAQGEWLYFLGSDDWLYNSESFEDLFNNDVDSYDVIYGDVEGAYYDIRQNGEWTWDRLNYNRIHQAVLYKKSVFTKLGYYNLIYRVSADHDLNLKWRLNPSIRSMYFPLIIAHFCGGGTSAICIDRVWEKDYELNILRYGKKTLPIYLKKEFARRASEKTNKISQKFILQVYVILLRIYDKLRRTLRK